MSPSEHEGEGSPGALARTKGGRRLWLVAVVFLSWLAASVALDVLRCRPPLPGVVELEFSVPVMPQSRREPLITTGAAGRGDFLYVLYPDSGTLVFGYDSWGAGGPQAAPFRVQPGRVLRLRIAMPSLIGLSKGRPPSELEVAVEGGPVWRVPVSAHSCEAGSVQWATNRIGGTSCSGTLSGVLRRAGGHRVEGVGSERYFSYGERAFFRSRTLGWGIWVHLAIASFASWLCLRAIPWRAIVMRLRGLMEVPAWAHPEGDAEKMAPSGGQREGEAFGWLRVVPAVPFFAGFALAFLACVALGYAVSRGPMFRSFVRFFQPIQPQTYFYPTARELVAQVEGNVPRDKILVLVGGASYFRGTGQNPSELWTHELQRLLGPRYAVVNFAIDQAGPSAFAAVVFQALRDKYPKCAYICTGGPFANDPLDGGDVYRYLYWDAYYKGMLGTDSEWNLRVRDTIDRQMQTEAGSEMHLGKRLDAATYACDLWTWVAYNHASLVWTDSYPLHPFRARRDYVEGDDVLMREHQLKARKDEALVRLLEERNLGASRTGYIQGADGRWTLDPLMRPSIADQYGQMLPPECRTRSLVVLMHANPYFMKTLTADDRRRLRELNTVAQEVLETIGYQAVQAGADFSEDDFVDGGHLMPSGGKKVARIVAEKIVRMCP